jgi:type I restriction enzyme S subunit
MAGDAADEKNLRIQKGDLAYNTMRMWQGAVGIAMHEGMVSPAYVVLSPKENHSSEFFFQRTKNARLRYLLWAYSYGLTSDRLRLYYADFARIPIRVPVAAEQQKIAAFLGAVDAKVDALRRKHDGLKQFKSGLMQKLFSKELRFKRDDGSDFPDWEEKRLGDVASFTKGKGISKADIEDGGRTPCIRYGEIYTVYREVISDIVSATNVDPRELRLSKGGEVIIPASGEDPLDMARACVVGQQGVALGGDINIMTGIPNGTFFAYYLNNAKRREIARLAQGNSVSHLYGSHLSSIQIEIPHPDEQQKIADCLSAVDAKIEAVYGQITQMEAFKKGLLQKMFV